MHLFLFIFYLFILFLHLSFLIMTETMHICYFSAVITAGAGVHVQPPALRGRILSGRPAEVNLKF